MTVKDLRKWLEGLSQDAVIEVLDGFENYKFLHCEHLRAIRIEREGLS
jgi:hypothetical protein